MAPVRRNLESQKMISRYYQPPPLTQQDIDRPLPPVSRRGASWKEALQWLDGQPGGIITIVATVFFFALFAWGAYTLWQISQTLRG